MQSLVGLVLVLCLLCFGHVSADASSSSSDISAEASMMASLAADVNLDATARGLSQQERINELIEGTHQVLLETMTEVGNPLNGQVGLEIEFKSSPRVVLRATNAAVPAHLQIAPLKYGDRWTECTGAPAPGQVARDLFHIENDNESPHLVAGAYLDAWLPHWRRRFPAQSVPVATRKLTGHEVGTGAAMELVTDPTDMDRPVDLRIQQTALKKFHSLIYDGVRRAAPFNVVPLADEAAANFAVAGIAGNARCIRYETFRTLYNNALTVLNQQRDGISAYALGPERRPGHVTAAINWLATPAGGNIAAPDYRFYLCFPHGVATTYAPQINFGYPVANFASANANKRLAVASGPGVAHHAGMAAFAPKFTGYVVAHIQAEGAALMNGVTALLATHPAIILAGNDLADAQGFITLFLYYYFHRGYMGNENKGVHNVMIKASINDVLRSLPLRAREAIARWVRHRTLANVQADFLAAAGRVYVAGALAAAGYNPIQSAGERTTLQTNIVANVFTFANGAQRWTGETAVLYGGAVVDAEDYPVGFETEGPNPNTVAPFTVRGRVSVLVESRNGGSQFNLDWTNRQPWSQAVSNTLSAVRTQTIDLQTVLLQQQQQQQQQQQRSSQRHQRILHKLRRITAGSSLAADVDSQAEALHYPIEHPGRSLGDLRGGEEDDIEPLDPKLYKNNVDKETDFELPKGEKPQDWWGGKEWQA